MTEQSKLSREALEIVKAAANKVWEKYDDTYGYRTEKQERNNKVTTDLPDNVWFFINQFDIHNQVELLMTILMGEPSPARQEMFTFLADHLKEENKEIERLKETIEEIEKTKIN
jgi:hypothetical protein